MTGPDTGDLWGLPPEFSAAKLRADLEEMVRQQLTDEAGAVAAGARFLTVATGDLESQADADRLEQRVSTAQRGIDGAHLRLRSGTNDTVTFRFEGPNAELLVERMAALAQQLDPGWWHIRRTTR